MWLSGPVNDIGGAFLTTGLLAIFFQYIDEADSDKRADERLRRVLAQEAPAIRDAVVDGFAFAPDSLTAVASPQTLDRIIENCLAIQLGDQGLASDAYTDLREQVMRARPRIYHARVSVVLSPWPGGPDSGNGSMFTATIRREYRTVPSSPVMRFACVSDLDEYRDLLDDPSYAIVWHFRPVGELDGSSSEAFQLLQVTADGVQLASRRTARGKGQIFTVNIGEQLAAAHEFVTLSYTYRTLVQRHGHLLHLDISHPTKGLHVEFMYKGCHIGYVNVLDYIAGAQQPQIAQLPASDPTPSVEIGYDGWVFPKGGVAFVWVLESELARSLPARAGGAKR